MMLMVKMVVMGEMVVIIYRDDCGGCCANKGFGGVDIDGSDDHVDNDYVGGGDVDHNADDYGGDGFWSSAEELLNSATAVPYYGKGCKVCVGGGGYLQR